MKRVAVAVLLLVLLGVAACGTNRDSASEDLVGRWVHETRANGVIVLRAELLLHATGEAEFRKSGPLGELADESAARYGEKIPLAWDRVGPARWRVGPDPDHMPDGLGSLAADQASMKLSLEGKDRLRLVWSSAPHGDEGVLLRRAAP